MSLPALLSQSTNAPVLTGPAEPAAETGTVPAVTPEIEALLKEFENKPSGRRAAGLGMSYYSEGNFKAAADSYLQAAELYRKKTDRARSYYNAATAIIEANRQALESASAPSGGNPPALQDAVNYLHRCLDLTPGSEEAAYNMEVAKILQALQDQQEDEQEQQEQEEEQPEGQGAPQQADGTDQQNQNANTQDQQGEQRQKQEAASSENGEDQQEAAQTAQDDGEKEEMSEEELQERLSEILGSEEENRQLREALMEKRGGISDVERDW